MVRYLPYRVDQNGFINDFEEAQNKAKGPFGTVTLDVAWDLYTKTYDQTLGFQVIGRLVTSWVKRKRISSYKIWNRLGFATQLSGSLVGIGAPEQENFIETPGQVGGALLKVETWNFTVNDAWLLAGVQGKQTFVAASPLKWNNILHKKYGLTVLGRELAGLAISGYVREDNGKQVAFYSPKLVTFFYTLVEYQDKMSTLTSSGEAKDFFESYHFNFN
jgi:hypothetical protein